MLCLEGTTAAEYEHQTGYSYNADWKGLKVLCGKKMKEADCIKFQKLPVKRESCAYGPTQPDMMLMYEDF